MVVRKMLIIRPISSLGICLAGFLIAKSAFSQSPADEFVRQQYQKAQAQRLKDLARQTPTGEKRDASVQTTGANSDVCFPVDSVVVEGSLRFADEIETAISVFNNKCIGIADINTLLRVVTNVYLDHGLITSRAYVPEQDLAHSRVLRIQIVEGILAEIKLNSQPDSNRQLGTAFPGMKGEVANMRDVEQGLDQINRLRSRKAKSEFLPGSNEGSTILNVNIEETKPWHISLGNSNLGQASTGLSKTTTGLTLDDMLGLNDIVSLSYERSGPDYTGPNDGRGSSNGYSGNISIPYGYWTYTLSGSWYDYATNIPGAFGNIETSGTSGQGALTIERVVARDADSLTKMRAGLAYKQTDNFLLGQRIEVGSRQYSVGSFRLSHSLRALGSIWNVDLGLERGLPWLDSIDAGSPAAGDAEPRFTKLTVATSVNKPVSIGDVGLTLSTQASLQWSPDNLFGAEQISLGGWSSVRGSRESLFFGNQGYFVRNEVSTSVTPWKNVGWATETLGELQPYVGLDLGQVFSQERFGIDNGKAVGMTAGARLSGGHFNVDAGYSAIRTIATNDQNREIFFFSISTQW